MNTFGLHPEFEPRDSKRRYIGIALVLLLHVLLGYGIVTGTARNALEMVKKPLQAVLVEEVIIPPPPPPPPPKEIVKQQQAPKVDAPPPPFVPPPDVPPPVTAAPSIQSVATPPPQPAVIAPPPPPAPAPVARSAPTSTDIRIVCPTQVKPETPPKALREGTQGVVKVQLLIRDGAVTDVTFLSGPRVFYPAVRASVMQYKCLSGAAEVLLQQEFSFKLEE